jgi:hypothetical protein
MSDVVIKGNASGTGSVTIESPNTNSNFTLTLPTETGTVLTNNGNQAGTFSSLTVNSNNISADNSLGFRNRIINGDMRIDQRNAGASYTNSNQALYGLDRWRSYGLASAVLTVQQSTTAPAGFSNSQSVTVTTSTTANDAGGLSQIIEGNNVFDLNWGTSSGVAVTASFWVRASVTGTYNIFIRFFGSTASYYYVATYTVDAANTWEQKTVNIAAPPVGAGAFTAALNSSYLEFRPAINSSGNTTTVAGNTWSTSTATKTSGSVDLASNSGATFYITGVQLEVGSVATPFERRPFGTELALCQRYYYRMVADNSFSQFGLSTSRGSTQSEGLFPLPVTMRVAPTLLDYSTLMLSIAAGASNTPVTAATINSGSNNKYVPNVTFTVGANFGSAGQALQVLANNSTSAYIGFGAEL